MERNLRNHASKLAASLLELGHPAALPAGPGAPGAAAVASPPAATDGDLARALAFAVAADADAAADPGTSDARVPAAFFERNEAPFRGVVKRAVLPDAYGALDAAAAELAAAVSDDFPPNADVVYDVVNNGLSFKPAAGDGDGFVAPLDRHRRPQHHKRTSPRVEAALGSYVAAAEACAAAAAAELRALAAAVYGGHVDAALASTALAQVCGAAFDHAQAALEKSWGSAAVGPDLALRNVSPFWLPRDAAAGNDVALKAATSRETGPAAAAEARRAVLRLRVRRVRRLGRAGRLRRRDRRAPGRLARHDATYGDRSPALVVALGDKSASRKLEAAVIRRLRRGGVPLLSTDDGAHVAFGAA
ncbi:MutS domain containing protein [Aureococcus anophagefferens]|nr:MutS domain containing protein [Aureococcus anophagefferens]